jgi:hypothetical protein
MDYQEMLRSVSQSAGRAWERVRYLTRANRVLALSVFLLLSVGLVLWARTGFTLGLFQPRAACEFQFCAEPNPVWNPVECRCEPSFGSVSPSPSIAKKTPWKYWDYATKSCLEAPITLHPLALTAVGGQDYDDARCGGPGTAGQCRLWTGPDENSWKPMDTPANLAACEPLSKIDSGTFPGYNTTEAVPPPITFDGCFSVYDLSSDDPNWGTMTSEYVPIVLRDNPSARIFMKAFVVNNCPWEVHYVIQVDASKKATFLQGAGQRELQLSSAESAIAFKDNMPPGYDIPSCWNKGGLERSPNCAREISIEYNLNTYTCGSLGITTAIWHRVKGGAVGGQNAKAGTSTHSGTLQFATAMNYGKDCTGAVTERAPGSVSTKTPGGGGTCPALPAQSLVKPAVLTVQCGTTQNVLNWQDPKTLNAAVNSVSRTAVAPTGPPVTAFIYSEAGCWNTFSTQTYTDKTVQAGITYEYSIKTHPNVRSNVVACRNGVQVVATSSPTPITSPVSTVLTGPGATPTPVVISPTPVPIVPTPPGPIITPPLSGAQLQCGPLAQTVGLNQQAFVQAFGGTGSYSFTTSTDGQLDLVAADRAGVRYSTSGPRVVTVTDGQSSVQCTITVSQTISGGAGSPGGVQTGPGEATLLALVVSSLVSLLYVSYAHSPLYRRREAEKVSEDRTPLDFRS